MKEKKKKTNKKKKNHIVWQLTMQQYEFNFIVRLRGNVY